MQLVILDATTKSLKGCLVGTVTANQPSFVVSWADSTSTNVAEGETDGLFNNTTDVTLTAAPGADTKRLIKDICIHNNDTVVAEFVIKYDNNGTQRVIWQGTIAAGAVWYLSRTLSAGGVQIIDDGAVTLAKLANLAQDRIIGRATASTGVPEAMTAAQVRAMINVADGATANAAASSAETNTGTDAAKFVTPDGLAGSNAGIRYLQITCFDYATDTATGDGKGYLVIPAGLNGMNLVSAHAQVITAGTTNTTDVQIANVTDAADMLSTKLTIDSAEIGSDTAATPAVIDATHDDVATNDLLRIDVDAVSTVKAKGLIVTLGFQLP